MSNKQPQSKPKEKADDATTEVANGGPSSESTSPVGEAKPQEPKPPSAASGSATRRSEPRRPPPQVDDFDDEPEQESPPPTEEPILKVASGRSIISSKRGILGPDEIVFPSDLVQTRTDEDWRDQGLREKALRLLRLGACVKL